MKYAIIPHILGTIFAAVIGWFLPAWCSSVGLLSADTARPLQWAVMIVAIMLGVWRTYNILRGRDDLANATAKHFDSKKKGLGK